MQNFSKKSKLLCFLLSFVLLGLWAQTKTIESYHSIDVNQNLAVNFFNGVPNSSNNTTNNSNTSNATALRIETIQGNHSQPALLTCEEIQNLEIIRQIGKGMSKTVFEVKLPGSRGNAIAKRIHRLKKTDRYLNLIKKESNYLKKLQKIYGVDETLGFFGECKGTSQSLIEKLRRDGVEDDVLMRNFSIGYTAIVELGTPLLPEGALVKKKEGHPCHQDGNKCFGNHFTELDVEDLIKIARQYANFDGSSRLIMSGSRGISDNCKPEQYVMTANGLRHTDLEMVYECKRKHCSYEEALEINCSTMRLLVNNTKLDCLTRASKEIRRGPRINTTAALEECSALFPTTVE